MGNVGAQCRRRQSSRSAHIAVIARPASSITRVGRLSKRAACRRSATNRGASSLLVVGDKGLSSCCSGRAALGASARPGAASAPPARRSTAPAPAPASSPAFARTGAVDDVWRVLRSVASASTRAVRRDPTTSLGSDDPRRDCATAAGLAAVRADTGEAAALREGAGSSVSGSRYSPLAANLIPRCRCALGDDRRPLRPTVPIGWPAATESCLRTASDPRCRWLAR